MTTKNLQRNLVIYKKKQLNKKENERLPLLVTHKHHFWSNEQWVRITSVSNKCFFFCFRVLLFPGVTKIFLRKLIALRHLQSLQPQVVRPTDSEKEVLTAVSRGSPVTCWMTF